MHSYIMFNVCVIECVCMCVCVMLYMCECVCVLVRENCFSGVGGGIFVCFLFFVFL